MFKVKKKKKSHSILLALSAMTATLLTDLIKS